MRLARLAQGLLGGDEVGGGGAGAFAALELGEHGLGGGDLIGAGGVLVEGRLHAARLGGDGVRGGLGAGGVGGQR